MQSELKLQSMVKLLCSHFCIDGLAKSIDVRLFPTAEDGSNGTVQFAPIPGPAYVSGFRSGHGVPELNTPKFDRPPGAVPTIGPIPGAHLQDQAQSSTPASALAPSACMPASDPKPTALAFKERCSECV